MHSNSWIYPKYSISKNKPSQGVKNFHAGPTFAHISTQIREWIRNRFLHTNLPPQSRRSGISRALQLQTAGFLPEGVWVSVWESVCVCVCEMVRDCCWVPKNEKVFNQTEAELREWVYVRLAACQVKSSHLYLYSAFNNTNCNKALHNITFSD